MRIYYPNLLVISLIFSLFLFFTAKAQNLKQIDPIVGVSHAHFIGKTSPLHHYAQLPMSQVKREKKHRIKPVPNFPGRRKVDQTLYPAPPFGEDPVRQANMSRDSRFNGEPKFNVEGIDRAFAGPRVPDTDGDIGKDYYLQCVNASYFQVFDKQGNRLGSPVDFNTLWSPLGFTSAGDPVILYDQEFERWIITEFPSGNQLLVAVSETSDPLGSYMAYNFATPRFPDYPKYGIWKNTIYVTTNESGPSVHHTYFLDRTALMNGDATIPIQRIQIDGVGNSPGFMVATPVDWSGSIDPPVDAKPMVMYIQDDAWGEVNQDQIEIFTFDVDFEDENNTTVTQFSLPTAPFDAAACAAEGFGFDCIPQPNSRGIDGLPWVIMNQTHYRNFGSHESIVLNFVVDYTGTDDPIAGIRWMELRRMDPTMDWTIYQEGTFAPEDGLHRFMGAIAMDGLGNIGLAYNVSSETEFAGLRYTGRRVNDPLGTMTLDEYNLATGLSATSDDRFGDYATMSVDPVDDRTFWFTGEYMKENNLWGTKVVAFNLFRDSVDIGPSDIISPVSAPALTNSENAEFVVKNFGLDTIYSFSVGYQLNNDTAIIELIDTVLLPDSSMDFLFNPTLDLSRPGAHSIRFFTELSGDTNPGNNELARTIINIPFNDAAITALPNFETFLCGSETSIPIELTNMGFDTLGSVDIQIILEDRIIDTIAWTGWLEMGESEIISYDIEDLMDGINNVQIVCNMPNMSIDEVPANDTLHVEITSNTTNKTSRLILIPDRFPDEITWVLENEDGMVLYSGGPYGAADSIVKVEWCLPPECHTFTIFDASNDGICCGFGEGSYEIIDPSGNILVSSNGDYGGQEESMFCLDSCVVAAEIDVLPVSSADSSDGAIMIAARNGSIPYRFSVDGGTSFQFSNTFNNLPAGNYAIAVRDRDGCVYRDTIEINTCSMEVVVGTTNESGVDVGDGSISFMINGGSPPIMFSMDNGVTFQTDTLFTNLSSGIYSVIVKDDIGCAFSDSILVDLSVNTTMTYSGQSIKIYPNPTDGVFVIEVRGVAHQKLFLPFQIHDQQGRLIQASRLVKYNDMHTGEVTLQRNPSGNYFLVFPGDDINRMIRILKY